MIKELTIRPALPSEWELLVDLQRKAALGNVGDRQALLEHPEAIAIPCQHLLEKRIFAAMVEGVPRGFATIIPREDGDSEIDALFVDPDCWGHGIGRALVDHCISIAKHAGASVLHVIGNPQAEGFYHACGFIKRGDVDMRFGTGLVMERQLE